jgi:hypothetical protein
MISYDVILRMDWLARHLVIIDGARKQVTRKPWGEGEVTYVGWGVSFLPLAKKLIIGRGQAFLSSVIALVKKEKKDLQDIPVVREYPNIFSTDYSRLLP